MKKLFTIAVAMTALFFVSVSAKAQYPSSRNMERRDQFDNDDQYNQRSVRVNPLRPKVTIIIGANGRRGNNGYNDRRRYNDHRRYNNHRRYSRYDRHDRYDRNHHRRSNHRNW